VITPIQEDERRSVAALVLQYLTMGVANTLVMSASFAAFFAWFDAEQLTLVYLANGAVISGITTLFLRLTRRSSFRAAMLGLSACLAASIAVAGLLWLFLDGPPWVAFALPVLFQTLVVLNNLIIWTLAGRLFDLRQGRRLFGLINTSFWFGAIPTGLLLPLLVPLLGLSGLLLAAAFVSCIAFVELIAITRFFAPRIGQQSDQRSGTRDPIGTVLRDRYVQLLFSVTVCGWLAFYAIDNIFYDLTSQRFPTADAFAGFMGLFMAAMGIATIAAGWLGSRRIIDRLGVPGTLLLLPAILTVLAAVIGIIGLLPILAAAMFWLAAGTRLLNTGLRNALTMPAVNLTFQPLPVARRATVQTVTEGVVQPLAIGLAGLALLLLRGVMGLDAAALAWALAAISLLWAVGSIRLGTLYRDRLGAALRGRLLDSSERLPVEEADLLLLEDRLHDERPAVVAYAIDMLERHAPARYAAKLPMLLLHPDRIVRADDRRSQAGSGGGF
jgi:AAA family ATP:ADP antiporter